VAVVRRVVGGVVRRVAVVVAPTVAAARGAVGVAAVATARARSVPTHG